MDWLNLLAVQETLKSLLQNHRSEASIFRHSAFFILQLSHAYMTTGKTIALTRWTFVGKAMSLFFNMLSSLVITFLTRSKRLLILYRPNLTCRDLTSIHLTSMHYFACSSRKLEPPRFSSVQFSRSVVSASLWSHESQHASPLCPSPTPGVHSDSRPLSQWCHPAISSCCPLLLLPPISPSIRVFSNAPQQLPILLSAF